MTSMSSSSSQALAQALGRIPTGLYIVTTLQGEEPIGFVGSFLMQVAFDPPGLCLAIAKERPHLDAIRGSGVFGVSILGEGSSSLMGPLLRKTKQGDPFDELRSSTAEGGVKRLDDALAFLSCRFRGEHDAGDHVVVFGEVESGELLREGEPAIHLRRNGLSY
jgi:flavin reductase (DIM6/NTAB) family NADH-FMN oxidoreductase RutF